MKLSELPPKEQRLRGLMFSAHDRRGPRETVELASHHLELHPGDGLGWLVYGSALTELYRYDEAAGALRKALSLFPPGKMFLPQLRMGDLFAMKGSLRAAERWYERAIASEPAITTGLILLGNVLARQGRLREAKKCFRRAVKLDGDADEAYLNLGLLLRSDGDYNGAIECFDKAIELDPKYASAKAARRDTVRAIGAREKYRGDGV